MNSGSPKKQLPALDLDDNDDVFSDRPRNLRRRKKRRLLSSTALYRLRLIGMGLGGVFIAVIAFRILQKVVHPYQLGNEVGQQVAVLREQYNRQEKENAALRQRLVFLRSKEGAEVEARRAGFHRKGEIVYLLPTTPETPEGSPVPSDKE
jgi:cell division protein FtsB